MGEQCRLENIRRVIEAMGLSYLHLGVKLDVAAALAEFDQIRERQLGQELNARVNMHQTFV